MKKMKSNNAGGKAMKQVGRAGKSEFPGRAKHAPESKEKGLKPPFGSGAKRGRVRFGNSGNGSQVYSGGDELDEKE